MEAVFFGIATAHARGEFGRRRISEDWFLTQFLTPFRYEKDGVLRRGEAGDLMIVPPGMPVYHGPLADAQEGFVNDWLYLRGAETAGLLARYPLPLCTAFSVADPGLFRTYLEAVKRESTAQEPGCGEMLLYLTGQLMIALHRARQRGASNPMETARQAMLRAPEAAWTIAALAERSGYSISRFSALYRERYGVSPKQELMAARVRLACGLLRYGGQTVSEVAYASGFRSVYHFSNYFKTAVGVSPRAYAERDKLLPKFTDSVTDP